jgi:hypothetical protein
VNLTFPEVVLVEIQIETLDIGLDPHDIHDLKHDVLEIKLCMDRPESVAEFQQLPILHVPELEHDGLCLVLCLLYLQTKFLEIIILF